MQKKIEHGVSKLEITGTKCETWSSYKVTYKEMNGLVRQETVRSPGVSITFTYISFQNNLLLSMTDMLGRNPGKAT